MGIPYRARVNERVFLNLPGSHGGAYVLAYVEDTSERGLLRENDCDDPTCKRCSENFEPRMILELADCRDRINLEFDVDSEAGRANSLHKLDTLITALRIFRDGIVAEFEPYDPPEELKVVPRPTFPEFLLLGKPIEALRAWKPATSHR